MGIDKPRTKESVNIPKVHSIAEFTTAIKKFDREQLSHSDPIFVAMVSVCALAHYVHAGTIKHLEDATPSEADENTLMNAWNSILDFVDKSNGRISARDVRQDERSEHPQWPDADPHLQDYRLVIPQESDAAILDVLFIDFLYEVFRGKKAFNDFVATDLGSLKMNRESPMYKLCKDKPWWSDEYLSKEAAAEE